MTHDRKPGEKRSPIKRKPLPSAGDSLRHDMDRVTDDIMPYLLAVALLAFGSMLSWISRWNGSVPSPWLFTSLTVIALILCGLKFRQTLCHVRRLAMARDGERAVAEHLESELRRDGFEFFHDIPGDGFNIDHLVVGPTGTFVIETKTYSKPVGRESRVAISDRGILVDGRKPTRDPLNQARANARWVRGLLLEVTGRPVFVQPIVVFPGWFVEPMPPKCDVWVLNEKPTATFIRNARGQLDEITRAQVCGQIRQYLSRRTL